MGFKVGIISQSQEFIRLICSLFDQSVEPVVSQGYYYQATDVAREMASHGVRVIIARERTADLIEKAVPVDVVHCDFAAIDSLIAISKATPEDLPIAFVNESTRNRQHYTILRMAEKMCGQKISIINYSDFKSLEGELQAALLRGVRCIIGGQYAVEAAAQFGFKTIEILTNYESAQNAVGKVKLIQKSLEDRADQDAKLLSALNTSESMYIAAGLDHKIITLNAQAESLTGLVRGNNIEELFAEADFRKQLDLAARGEAVTNQVHKLSGTNIFLRYSLYPIVDSKSETKSILMRLDKDEKTRMTAEKGKKDNLVARYSFDDIIGSSSSIVRAKLLAREYAKYQMNILITGATGTGKELFAHSIHRASERASKPFVAVNCASIPATLLESELFGYEDGAFTGAKRGGKIGLFELANGGTFFMDEVGELPLDMQARLLRVLQSREIRRLGGKRQIPIDVRIISATNRDLNRDAIDGKFRSDLFYRLSTLMLEIPSLKDRREDIPELIDSLIEKTDVPFQKRPEVIRYINALIAEKDGYDWPGNVRELENVIQRSGVEYSLIERGLISVPGEQTFFSAASVPEKEPAAAEKADVRGAAGEIPFSGSLQEQEIEQIRRVGEQVNWNRGEMSRILGISYSTLWRKMKRFNILAEEPEN